MNVTKNLIKWVGILLLGGWLVTYLMLQFERHEYAELTPELHKAAAAYLDGKLTQAPDGWQWGTFEPEPGVKLRTGVWR